MLRREKRWSRLDAEKFCWKKSLFQKALHFLEWFIWAITIWLLIKFHHAFVPLLPTFSHFDSVRRTITKAVLPQAFFIPESNTKQINSMICLQNKLAFAKWNLSPLGYLFCQIESLSIKESLNSSQIETLSMTNCLKVKYCINLKPWKVKTTEMRWKHL